MQFGGSGREVQRRQGQRAFRGRQRSVAVLRRRPHDRSHRASQDFVSQIVKQDQLLSFHRRFLRQSFFRGSKVNTQ